MRLSGLTISYGGPRIDAQDVGPQSRDAQPMLVASLNGCARASWQVWFDRLGIETQVPEAVRFSCLVWHSLRRSRLPARSLARSLLVHDALVERRLCRLCRVLPPKWDMPSSKAHFVRWQHVLTGDTREGVHQLDRGRSGANAVSILTARGRGSSARQPILCSSKPARASSVANRSRVRCGCPRCRPRRCWSIHIGRGGTYAGLAH
jgi:hypothetical protein